MNLFIIVTVITIFFAGSFIVLYKITSKAERGEQRLSPKKYGAGAFHPQRHLPPISHSATSVPTGSNEPSHWPDSNAKRNR